MFMQNDLSCLTWESVVLQDDLMNDTTAWFPEAHSILGSCGGQEVVHFLVDILSSEIDQSGVGM